MKVLMTADPVGDFWTYTVELTRTMVGHQFVISTIGSLSAAQRAELPVNARVVELQRDVTHAGEWLLELEQREAPDLVHVNGCSHAALPFRSPKLVVAHWCMWSRWRAMHGNNPPQAWSRYHDEIESGLRGADFVVATSRTALALLHDCYTFHNRERVIYNGRSVQQPPDSVRFSVFSSGPLWDGAKNLRTVIDAAPRIHAPVKIAGEGESRSDSITHLGVLDAAGMKGALSDAAVYLLPALYEPLGLSILDAALAGCALVLGDIDSLREIWQDAAIFVPPRGAEAIADAVNELLADDDRRDAMAQRARKRAAQFNPGRMAIEYNEVYGLIAGKERGSAFRAEARSASAVC